MSDKQQKARSFYSEQQKGIAAARKEWLRLHPGASNSDWLNSSDYQEVRKQYRKGGVAYAEYHGGIVGESVLSKAGPSSPSKRTRTISDNTETEEATNQLKRIAIQTPEEGARSRHHSESSRPTTSLSQYLSGSDDNTSPDNTMFQMEIDPISNPEGGGAAIGSRDSSSSGGIMALGQSSSGGNASFTFTQSRIITSMGYANVKGTLTADDEHQSMLTSLTYIPVDYLPFYMSPAEFNQASRFPTKITHVSCVVKCLGVRTSFDTGTTLSGVANTEHVSIGLVGYGLNKLVASKNMKYKCKQADSMVPDTTEDVDWNAMDIKLWGNWGFDNMTYVSLIPSHLGWYWTYYTNRKEKTDNTFQHSKGQFRLDQHVKRFLIQSSIGKPVASYSYTPSHGYLGINPQVDYPFSKGGKTSGFYSNGSNIYNGAVDHNNGALWEGKRAMLSGETNTGLGTTTTYQRHLECDLIFSPSKGETVGTIQPSLHVGLIATPQINNVTNTEKYQQSSCYWSIETTITLESNFTTCWTHEVISDVATGLQLYDIRPVENTFLTYGLKPLNAKYKSTRSEPVITRSKSSCSSKEKKDTDLFEYIDIDDDEFILPIKKPVKKTLK